MSDAFDRDTVSVPKQASTRSVAPSNVRDANGQLLKNRPHAEHARGSPNKHTDDSTCVQRRCVCSDNQCVSEEGLPYVGGDVSTGMPGYDNDVCPPDTAGCAARTLEKVHEHRALIEK